MKKAIKIIIIVIAVIAVIAALCGAYMNGVPVTHNGMDYAEKYRSDESGDCVYFTDEDFGECESISYNVKDRKGLFRSVGSMFTVTYSDEQYKEQLDKINELDFLDAPCRTEITGEYVIPSEKVEENGWVIRVLSSEDGNNYPKQVAMIGTDDEEKTIVYMYFTDADLDYISETSGEDAMKQFIEQNFSFKF